jgi:hypothetical protein
MVASVGQSVMVMLLAVKPHLITFPFDTTSRLTAGPIQCPIQQVPTKTLPIK